MKLLSDKIRRDPSDEARMTFIEHLTELRTRIIYSAVAIFVAFLICYAFSNQLFEVIRRPLMPLEKQAKQAPAENKDAAPQQKPSDEPAITPPKWTVLNPLESFLVKLKLSGYAALLFASPIIIYQICAFVFPGLKPNERKLVRILIFGCAGFALFGVLVGYFAVFPFVLQYMALYVPAGVELQFRMNETMSQILLGLMGFAVAFQFPMVSLALVYLGLLQPATLKKYRRLAIVVMAITAAILTPPDPVSMLMMLTPMVILYEISIWISYIVLRRKKMQEETV
jgi:sec-independent protein translocase protein TatC